MHDLTVFNSEESGISKAPAQCLGETNTNVCKSLPRVDFDEIRRANHQLEDEPVQDGGSYRDRIWKHFNHIQRLAADFPDLKIVIIAIIENPTFGKKKTVVEHFTSRSTQKEFMAFIAKYFNKIHTAICISPVLMRADLEPGKKGGPDDVRLVVGLTLDFDDEDAVNYLKRIPGGFQYSLVVETSPGHFHGTIFFRKSIADVLFARELLNNLVKFSKCDRACKDIAHFFRMPWTLNWPGKSKVDRGRSPEPIKVTPVLESYETLMDAETLADALSQFGSENPDCVHDTDLSPFSGQSVDDIIAGIPKIIKDEITRPPRVDEDRSETVFKVIAMLLEHGIPQGDILAIFLAYPETIGARFHGNIKRIKQEILRIKKKIQEKKKDPTHDQDTASGQSPSLRSGFGGTGNLNSSNCYAVGEAPYLIYYNNGYEWVGVKSSAAINFGLNRAAVRGLPYAQRLVWIPSTDSVISFDDGRMPELNTYWIPEVQPTEGMPEESELLLQWLLHLCGGDIVAHEYLLDWMARAYQNLLHGGKKYLNRTAIILVSKTEGTGKNSLFEMLAFLYHPANCKTMTQAEMESPFTGPLDRCVLLHCEEFAFIDGKAGQRALEKLKPLITNDQISVITKGVDARNVTNYLNIIISSNHVAPLKINSEGDRRFSVFRGDEVFPRLLEITGSDALKKRFAAVLGGILANRKIVHDVSQPYQNAARQLILDLSRSPTMQFCEALERQGFDGLNQELGCNFLGNNFSTQSYGTDHLGNTWIKSSYFREVFLKWIQVNFPGEKAASSVKTNQEILEFFKGLNVDHGVLKKIRGESIRTWKNIPLYERNKLAVIQGGQIPQAGGGARGDVPALVVVGGGQVSEPATALVPFDDTNPPF